MPTSHVVCIWDVHIIFSPAPNAKIVISNVDSLETTEEFLSVPFEVLSLDVPVMMVARDAARPTN